MSSNPRINLPKEACHSFFFFFFFVFFFFFLFVFFFVIYTYLSMSIYNMYIFRNIYISSLLALLVDLLSSHNRP